MSGKRHSSDEIAAKLSRANEMMREGKRNAEIAKALGISLMTYHRWRKDWGNIGPKAESGKLRGADRGEPKGNPDLDRLQELGLENERLRRLVTDMLLEKVACKEKERTPNATKRG